MIEQNQQGFSEPEYAQFALRVQAGLGIRLTDYKVDQMKRRLETIARQAKCESFSDYYLAIKADANLHRVFLDHMTINVTELMRNVDIFEELGRSVLPNLAATRKGAQLSAWSAGCSYGAEAYTVAMLINEMDPTLPFRIKGTDIDLTALAKANSALFSKADMNGVSPERRAKYFMELDENSFMPQPSLRRNISFGQHDMLGDDYPTDFYDLILCRNVVIYFNDEAKERIYRNFWKALRPGGVLFVGGTERLSDYKSLNFKPIQPFFYEAEKSGAFSERRLAA
jgi:chemotaxis protein methyltransferase CheR